PSKADAVGGNFRRRIAPGYAAPLDTLEHFAAKIPSLDTSGLIDRDLLSSCYAGLLSVRALSTKLAAVFGEDKVRPFDEWRVEIRDCLRQARDRLQPTGVEVPALAGPLEPFADDPPLPFFVLFEAQFGSTVD